MIILRNGDRLPTVAVLQSYLNQQPSTRPLLAVDGAFGPKTRAAVRQFQVAARLTPSGVVDWEVWKRVVGSEWQIIDWVDHSTPAGETDDLKPYAQTLLESFGMSKGGQQLLARIQAAGRAGQVVLLRFHGHGGAGHMRLAGGVGVDHRQGERMFSAFRPLRPMFAPFGSIELHGCRLGAGAHGRSLLAGIAGAAGVPASGGIQYQYGGGATTFRFEGPTVTYCPCYEPLRAWSRRVGSASRLRPTTFV